MQMSPQGGVMPPNAAAAMPSKPAPAANAFHQEIVRRLRTITPEEKQALISGISPEAAMVLKRLLPEIAALIDASIKPRGAAPARAPAPMPRRGPQPQGAPRGPSPVPRPTTRLGSM